MADGKDNLTFTLRLHDPKEKKDAELSTSWAVFEIPREDLGLPPAQFIDRYIVPGLAQLKQLQQK